VRAVLVFYIVFSWTLGKVILDHYCISILLHPLTRLPWHLTILILSLKRLEAFYNNCIVFFIFDTDNGIKFTYIA
jgi:hypothetical protein